MDYKRLEVVHLAVKVEPRKRIQIDATMFREEVREKTGHASQGGRDF